MVKKSNQESAKEPKKKWAVTKLHAPRSTQHCAGGTEALGTNAAMTNECMSQRSCYRTPMMHTPQCPLLALCGTASAIAFVRKSSRSPHFRSTLHARCSHRHSEEQKLSDDVLGIRAEREREGDESYCSCGTQSPGSVRTMRQYKKKAADGRRRRR